MYFRVRATLTERPGALARLAARCGDAGLNILGLQIFPDLGHVTDELVISTPEHWTAAAVTELVSGAGGDEVSVEPCTTHDLLDQPTRWLNAAQDVLGDPALLPALVERLLGTDTGRWSATEHARVEALRGFAEPMDRAGPGARGASVEYDETGAGVLARIGGRVVGAAAFDSGEPDTLTIEVAPAWRRLGIGSTLLTRSVAQAAARGAHQVLLLAPAGDEGFVPMVATSGLSARIKVSGGLLQARFTLSGTVHPAGPLAEARWGPPGG